MPVDVAATQGEAPATVYETSKTLLLPTWVKVPEMVQFEVSPPVKLMPARVVGEKVRDRVSVTPSIPPVLAPERAVGAPLRGEKGTAETVPADTPLKMPVILPEATLPCSESVIVVAVLEGAG